MCLKFNPGFSKLRIVATTLTPYAVTTRYPGDLADISPTEAIEALELARAAWDFILAQLPVEVS
jgi:hypothetical protein